MTGTAFFESSPSLRPGVELVSGQVVIHFLFEADPPETLLNGLLVRVDRFLTTRGWTALYRFTRDTDAIRTSAEPLDEIVDEITRANVPGVVSIGQNSYATALSLPNDPNLDFQWNLPMINLPLAWRTTAGSPNVVVAVMDTGTRFDHLDLSPNLLPGRDFISNPIESGDGDGVDTDATDPDPKGPAGEGSHGTHVSGIIGAVGDNGIGICGVAWGCRILPVRVLGLHGGTDFDVQAGYNFVSSRVARSHPAAGEPSVLNLSFGRYRPGPGEREAVQSVQAKDIVVVAAAGNGAMDLESFPASFPGVLSVAAVERSGQLASYSNFGPRIDVTAPGGELSLAHSDEILSTIFHGPSGDTTDLGFMVGTSMAAPHVSGLAALIRSVDPSLSATRVAEIIKGTATTPANPEEALLVGYGTINALRAVEVASGYWPPAPRVKHPFIAFSNGALVHEDEIVNSGSGTISLEPQVISSVPWATGRLNSTITPATISVNVTRTGLTPGGHSGHLTVSTSAGPAYIHVYQEVEESASDLGKVTILGISKSTGAVVATTSTSYLSNFTFTLSGLPSGDYRVVAGTDRETSGTLGMVGEFFGEPQAPDGTARAIPVVAPGQSGPITIPIARLYAAQTAPSVGTSRSALSVVHRSNGPAYRLLTRLAEARARAQSGQY